MKATILILISIITLMSISCDNYEISDKQSDSFLKFYGGGLKDEGMQVITTDDGYLIMGNIENPGRGKDICLIQTNKYGNSIAPITMYGGQWDDFGYVIKHNNSSGYFIAGSTQKVESGDLDVFLVQINSIGDTLWTKSYGRSLDDEAYDLLVLDNNHIVLTGYTDSTDVLGKDFLFIEVDAAGTLVNFNFKGLKPDEVAFSIVQKGNSYFLAGYAYRETTSQQLVKKLYVMQWDGRGSPIIPHYDPLGTSSEAVAIKALNQNEYILLCNVQPTQGSGSQIYLMKIDNSGRSIWEKGIGERRVNTASDLYIHDNSLYVVGTSTNEETFGDMLILKTSLSGDNPSYYYAGDGTSYQGNGFDFTSDGGYIITGSNFVNNRSVITLCKLNAEGVLR